MTSVFVIVASTVKIEVTDVCIILIVMLEVWMIVVGAIVCPTLEVTVFLVSLATYAFPDIVLWAIHPFFCVFRNPHFVCVYLCMHHS